MHDGAAGRHEPAEALAPRQEADRSCSLAAGAYESGGLQVGEHGGMIQPRVERPEVFEVQVYAGVEEAGLAAVEHDARVDELPALHAGHHAQ